ncbi:hypothetical protein AB4039_03735 [Streptomyces sp. M-16]|uniref:hypothetical protein n=1 Tax=Streptomyces sp. M-16 TaxID=3233040 RepID=UPI003F9C976A
MGWATWTTVSVPVGPGGVETQENGRLLDGTLDVRTSWRDGRARISLRPSGGPEEWFTMVGSPVPCPTAYRSRALHEAVVEAVRLGGAARPVGPQAGRAGYAPPAAAA